MFPPPQYRTDIHQLEPAPWGPRLRGEDPGTLTTEERPRAQGSSAQVGEGSRARCNPPGPSARLLVLQGGRRRRHHGPQWRGETQQCPSSLLLAKQQLQLLLLTNQLPLTPVTSPHPSNVTFHQHSSSLASLLPSPCLPLWLSQSLPSSCLPGAEKLRAGGKWALSC